MKKRQTGETGRKTFVLKSMAGILICAMLSGCSAVEMQDQKQQSAQQTETQTKVQTETQTKAQSETQIKAQSETQTKAQTETQTKAQMETQTKAQTETQTQTTQQADAGETHEISGVILDASMHALVIQSEAGQTLNFTLGEDGTDTSGLADGIILGNGISLTYTGTIQGNSTAGAVVKAEKDAKTVCTDSAALTAAGEVILAVENKDYDGFLDQCSFPVYVGIGNGNTVNDRNAFVKTYTAADIFTDQLVQSVSHVNLMKTAEKKGKLILSSEDKGKPDLVLTQKNGKWAVTGIYLYPSK